MAKRKAQESSAEPKVEAAETAVVSAPLPADTMGLAITAPQSAAIEPEVLDIAPGISHEMDDEPQDEDEEYEQETLTVDPNISKDPSATVAACLLAIGRLYNEAGDLTIALAKHMRNTTGQPELQGFLQRMQTSLGDFRHAVNAVEGATSEHLRDSIMQGVA